MRGLISFIFVFVRFYFGDIRFLDLSYQETHFKRGLENELSKYSGTKRFIDIMLLLNHGIFFYFMALYIGKPDYFVYFFLVLMFVNISWLLAQLAVNGKSEESDPLYGGQKGNYPMIIWIINNFVFIGLIMVVMFSEVSFKIELSIGLILLNSLIDLKTTWSYYFPDLKAIYESQLDSPNKS